MMYFDASSGVDADVATLTISMGIPPPFVMHVPHTNYNNFNFKKEQTILIPQKYNYTYE